MTQPIVRPWHHAAIAVSLRVALDRRAALVVEDEHALVTDLVARVFEVERVARLTLFDAEGAVIEKRVVAAGPEFAARVIDTAEFATLAHPGLVIELVHDPDPAWEPVCAGVRALAARLDEHVARGPIPAEVMVDRRRRVA